jgi:hypothetical protein
MADHHNHQGHQAMAVMAVMATTAKVAMARTRQQVYKEDNGFLLYTRCSQLS